MKKKLSFYEVLVYVAYGFFLLFGLLWFLLTLSNSHVFNTQALVIIVAFATQLYYKHKLTNLILGVLALFFSIWMLLEVVSGNDTGVKHASYDGFSIGLICFFSFSIIMSAILIFSYTKLSFKDQ